ncbi:hypothetical protein C8A03DRAFT_32716 [Achaetomium macrosporum]|uniref:Uncharacterized protein n=1 Tax=Achaetomium macrosporum TaxID=79813 RepID=A0AAN7CC07_9PEZI|nr:hypothetical protein C8A03DRAFT_32716 [Achaetomium macrosporum]
MPRETVEKISTSEALQAKVDELGKIAAIVAEKSGGGMPERSSLEAIARELLSIEQAYDPATEKPLTLPNGYGYVDWWSPWGYRVHLTQKAINALNNLGGVAESSAAVAGFIVALTGSALVTTVGVAGLIAGALAARAKVMYWIADGGELDLYSPWFAIVALIPMKSDYPWVDDDRLGFSVFKDGSWADGKPFIGGSTTNDGRGREWAADTIATFANHDGRLYAAFSVSTRAIYYCVYDPKVDDGDSHKGWSDSYQIGVYGCWPSLIEYDGHLYMFYSHTNGEIWWTRRDRFGWKYEQALRGGHAYTADRVGLAVFGGKLYLAARGLGDENVWMSTFDGNEWTPYAKIGASSSHGPALATFGGELHMVASGGGKDHRIWHYRFDGSNWRSGPLQSVYTNGMPSLAVFDGKLYCAAVGMEKAIWYMSYSGGSWSRYTETQLRSRSGPSLSAYTDKLSNRQDMLLCFDPRM